MIDIVSMDTSFLTIDTHDSGSYPPDVDYHIYPGPDFDALKSKVETLEQGFNAILQVSEREERLLSSHPGLKELRDQYITMLGLLSNSVGE